MSDKTPQIVPLIKEFDGDRHDKLRSWEGVLKNRSVRDGDYMYLKILSGETLLDTQWLRIGNTEAITIETDGEVTIDWYDLLVDALNYTDGDYTLEYCFKRMAMWPNEFVRVNEISKNKMEIRVDAIHEEELTNPRKPLIDGEYYAPFDLYHEKEGIVKAVYWTYDEHHEDETLILKLGDKIPRKIKVGDELEIWDEIASARSLELKLEIDLPKGLEEYVELRGPMVTLDVNAEVGKPTEFESWEKILTGSAEVNQNLTTKILSSSGYELNVDYRKFSNFIHFSSAKERLVNFEYKMKLVEFYDSKSLGHSTNLAGQASSSVTASEIYISESANYSTEKQHILGTFDKYEDYLYNESGSGHTDDEVVYYSTTWPKYDNPETHGYPKYINYSATSSQAQNWLTGSFESASRYDEDNLNILRKTIPAVQRTDPNNSGFVLFVDMIAQHFDILFNYIDNLKQQRVRDENLNEGISKDLLFDTLKSFGWKPKSGLDLENIWDYWLGTTRTGGYAGPGTDNWDADWADTFPDSGSTASSSWTTEPMPMRDLELEPISRIVNNLPYLLKTKGTQRGLKALLACYGIPSSFFKIQEFGGPDPGRHSATTSSHMRELDMSNHALQFQGGLYNQEANVSYLSGSWDNADAIQTVEFRFKTNYQNSQSLFITSQNAMDTAQARSGVFLIPSKSAGDPDTEYAYVKYFSADTNADTTYKSGSLGKLPILDNDWWNLALVNDDEGKKIKLICQKAPDHAHGNITHRDSIEIDYLDTDQSYGWGNGAVDEWSFGHKEAIWNDMYSGSADENSIAAHHLLDFFSGSLQELRFWANELDDNSIDLHSKSPTSIYGNSYSGSFEDLALRLPLGTDNNIDHNTASINTFTSTHPDQTKTGISTQTVYMSGSFEWEEEHETYFVQTPNSFGLRSISNKIRIEDNTVNGMLDPADSQESSSADTNPIDLADLYVSVSPQDDLDLDIGLQFGDINMDNYVGDPREARSTAYSQLRKLRDDYFKKFNGVQKIQAYVKTLRYINTALFQQIDSMLPARGTNVVGMMIKPTLLERSKVALEPSFSFQENQYLGKTGQSLQNFENYTQSIDCFNEDTLKTSDDYDAMEYIFDHDGTYASQWFSTLTDTVKTEAGTEPNRYVFNIARINQDGTGRDDNLDGSQLTMSMAAIMPQAYDQPTHNSYYKTIYQYSSSLSQSLHKWYSSSFEPTQIVQQDVFLGFNNSFVRGCKMTSDDFNVDSPDTIDGGPVVEFIEGNPNTLISKNPGLSGDLLVR